MKSYLPIGLAQIKYAQDCLQAASLGIARFVMTFADRSSIWGDRGNSDFNLSFNLGFNLAIKARNFIHPETYRISGRYRQIAVPT
ncbi:hypothetical protein H6F42_11695 [Pseudanabaena sp. FACHB-1998]|uniref:hypothetical protein n=1 Tax=Pseudanabaena sp. FACHB-1998 TaxID=2692858 RepID=UPI00168160CC|nr:hypothetical protein [Pseudanabaena sp. FACHB-1998]MBD2177576.1 hypothetical protein [Pseudanabaena sp. FACHB-1998]